MTQRLKALAVLLVLGVTQIWRTRPPKLEEQRQLYSLTMGLVKATMSRSGSGVVTPNRESGLFLKQKPQAVVVVGGGSRVI